MPDIQFAKYECMGNDFCVIDQRRVPTRWTMTRVTAFCDRRRGVGSDGLILLKATGSNEVRFCLFNADGSRAEWSGNGVRCAAAFVSRVRRLRTMTVVTDAGPIAVVCTPRDRGRSAVTINCPVPHVSPSASRSNIRVPRGRGPFEVDAGNPHWVYLVPNFDFRWEDVGARCQDAARETNGVNVEFVRIISHDRIELRLFERGVGPTPSSGSGALAAAAVCRANNLIDPRVRVDSPGGSQTVSHRSDDQVFRLTAVTRFVFAGKWVLE